MKDKISIIIPFLNEADSFSQLHSGMIDPLLTLDQFEFELVFVNDGSTDRSVEVLSKADFKGIESRVVSLSRNFGAHNAVFAGLSHTTGKYITALSGDFQDNVDVIVALHNEVVKGADVVFPLRRTMAQSPMVKFFSNMYASLMRRFAISNYPKQNFDTFFFNEKVKKAVIETYELNSSLFLHVWTLGFKQAYIQYDRKERKFGKSKWTLGKKIKLFVDSFIAFSYAPIRFVTYTGILFFMVGVMWTIYITARKLIYDDLQEGWPMLTSILLLGFGLTNISLGIIAEYLWRTLDASRKKPVYIIDEVIELEKKK